MEFYKETNFQKTEMGMIPSDWKVKNIIEISKDLIGGGTPSTKKENYWNGEISWMTSEHINGRIITKGQRNITKEGLENSASNIVPKDNLLVATRVGIGKASLNKISIAISQDLTGVIVNRGDAIPDYLFWFLQNNESKLISIAQGSTIKGILREDLGKFKISLPPRIEEQERIASILSRIDDTIQKTDGIIQKTQLLKKGLMQELLTKGIGHKDFKYSKELECKIPKEWAVSELGARCKVIMGQSPPSRTYNKDGDGIPFFQGNVDFGERNPMVRIYCSEPKKIAKKDDILFSVRAPVGELNIANRECCIGRGLAAIRVEGENNRDYVLYSIIQFLKNLVPQGSTFKAVGKTEMESFCLSFPRSEEQRQIASILSNVDDQIEKERQTKEQLERLKKGLMQILLTGKVRVKVN